MPTKPGLPRPQLRFVLAMTVGGLGGGEFGCEVMPTKPGLPRRLRLLAMTGGGLGGGEFDCEASLWSLDCHVGCASSQ